VLDRLGEGAGADAGTGKAVCVQIMNSEARSAVL
jgi:hypothetical protein